MRCRTSRLLLLERAPAHLSLLRFERPLVEDGAVQRFAPLPGQLLLFANGPEFGQKMFVACRVVRADLLLAQVERVEVLPEVLASGLAHGLRQVADPLLDRAVLALGAGLLAVAQEAAALGQVVERTAERMTVGAVVEVERFAQRPVAVVVGIAARGVVRALPAQELLVQRVAFAAAPCVQLVAAQRRTEVVFHEQPDQLDLSDSAAEVVAAQCTRLRPVLHGRLLVVLFACHALLEDVYAPIEQPAAAVVVVALHDRPADRVRAEVQSQCFRHIRFNFS